MEPIQFYRDCFVLQTKDTTYAFRLMEGSGQLEHLYYGRKIHVYGPEGLQEQHAFPPGNCLTYGPENPALSLEDACLEYSTCGRGDIREPMLELTNSDGSTSVNLCYRTHKISPIVEAPKTLPGSYDDIGTASQLQLELEDAENHLTLTLVYTVYPECNVITRRAVLCNQGEHEIRLERLLSLQLDFDRPGYVMTTFGGAWAREMQRTDTPLRTGRFVNASFTGTSSSRANPFVMMAESGADEDKGNCYGFHLLYSGNHYEAAEVSSHGKTRFVQGINPRGFSFLLQPGDCFEAPEAAMSFGAYGYNSLSRNLHAFVRTHIVRGYWRDRPRPVLLNSWEAAYFKINQQKLLHLAEVGKEVGIELFVVDDGWYGQRDDDTQSLGDWEVNEKKLPSGLEGLSKRIRAMGMQFGIWVEPEMVNVRSRLYEAHPDWTIDIPGKVHSEGRNQRILDLTRVEVQDYIIETMTRVFESAEISYVKWDMNRIFSDYYSRALPPERQGEVGHRYVMGLYRCMQVLTERFPEILFEGCAAGGNRFDLGILCYFPQIWASDNTDALCRGEIQTGYSYGYPQSVYTAHVSGVPNHQTLRTTPLETRYNIASAAVLGYECNLCDLSAEEKKQIAGQIAEYKAHRQLLQFGQLYRGLSFSGNEQSNSVLSGETHNITEWTICADDGREAIGVILHRLAQPNTLYGCYRPKGLKPELLYHIYNEEIKVDIREYGDLINTVSPIAIKNGSMMHRLAAKFVKLDGAVTDCLMYGDALMYSGVKLKQAYGATGHSSEVRHFPDFASIRFFIQEEESENQ